MNNKGFVLVEYIFTLFILFIIGCRLLFYSSSLINSSINIEDSVSHRIILNDVSCVISQVNSMVLVIRNTLNHRIKVILKLLLINLN